MGRIKIKNKVLFSVGGLWYNQENVSLIRCLAAVDKV